MRERRLNYYFLSCVSGKNKKRTEKSEKGQKREQKVVERICA